MVRSKQLISKDIFHKIERISLQTMPVSKIKWNSNGNGWAVWRIDEPEELLAAQVPVADACPEEIQFPRKRLEWLAGRTLLKYLAVESGLDYQGVVKDEFGKPYLKGLDYQISISNSFPYVAAQIHPTQSVGIDLEQPRPKLFDVMKRVLTESEWNDGANNLHKLCVYWCAKEALYKIYGKRSLIFTEHILVKPFALGDGGRLEGTILEGTSARTLLLDYRVEQEYILITTHSEN
jgi:4'-phosphopantetheinyl transferase